MDALVARIYKAAHAMQTSVMNIRAYFKETDERLGERGIVKGQEQAAA